MALCEIQMDALDQENRIGLTDIYVIFLQNKKTALIVAILVFASLIGYAIFSPDIYEAESIILPPSQSGTTTALPQLAGMANAVGGGTLLKNPNDMYIGMLKSQSVLSSLVAKFGLNERYGFKYSFQAIKKLGSMSTIKTDDSGFIQIRVEDKDPILAMKLANGYVTELQNTTRRLATSEAAQRRIFFETQVASVRNSLAQAEYSLKETQKKTGAFLPNSQYMATLDSVSTLRAQIATKEVRLSVMKKSATSQNPDVQREEAELAALREQMTEINSGDKDNAAMSRTRAPDIGLDYIRKQREIKYQEAFLEMTIKEYEMARVDEAKAGGMVQILDVASVPKNPIKPRRIAISIFAIFAGVFSGAFAMLINILIRNFYKKFMIIKNEVGENSATC